MKIKLQALKEAVISGDPNFLDQLDQIIAKSGSVENIEKTNLV